MSHVIMEEDNLSGNQLAYDLRQRYAKIVGDHLEDVADARRSKNYPDYLNALEDLHAIVQHRFKSKKSKKKEDKEEKKKSKSKKDTYEELREELVKIANEYSATWIGNSKDADEIGKIEAALRAIESFLYSKMSEAGMFGTKRELEGLT